MLHHLVIKHVRRLFGVAAICAFASALSVSATEAPVVIRDVAYLPASRSEKLDVWLPPASFAGPRPTVLVIHGGGWAVGDKADPRERNFADTLARAGYVVFSINYFLEKTEKLENGRVRILEMPWPQNVADCKTALRFIRKNAATYRVDPARIAVMGGSAGAHLAMLVGVTGNDDNLNRLGDYAGQSNQVSCIVYFYGTADLRRFGHEHFHGATPQETEHNLDIASPRTYITAKTPPLLIVHGANDTTIPVALSRDLAADLKAAGATYDYVEVPGAPHSFDLRQPGADLTGTVLTFLGEHL
ncbi:MAG: alpha/beta hydrolase [Opitutaceae bacterium]|jgi:acetyl esterase/lipase